MKIIKQTAGEVQVECPGCHALLEIICEDIVLDTTGVLHHHPDKDCYVKCVNRNPFCGRLIPLSTKDLPKHWINKLEEAS